MPKNNNNIRLSSNPSGFLSDKSNNNSDKKIHLNLVSAIRKGKALEEVGDLLMSGKVDLRRLVDDVDFAATVGSRLIYMNIAHLAASQGRLNILKLLVSHEVSQNKATSIKYKSSAVNDSVVYVNPEEGIQFVNPKVRKAFDNPDAEENMWGIRRPIIFCVKDKGVKGYLGLLMAEDRMWSDIDDLTEDQIDSAKSFFELSFKCDPNAVKEYAKTVFKTGEGIQITYSEKQLSAFGDFLQQMCGISFVPKSNP